MTGLQIGSKILLVKRAEAPSFLEIGDDEEGELIESEVFKDLFDVKPSCCIMLKNIVQVAEN